MAVPLYNLNPANFDLWHLFDSGEQLTPEHLEEIAQAISAAPDSETEQRIENLAKWIKDLELNAELPRKEARRLTERARRYEELSEQLRVVLSQIMTDCDLTRVRTSIVTVGVQPSPPAVVSIDMENLPDEFKRHVVEADKKKIVEYVKDCGEAPPGTIVDTNRRHVVIK